MLRLPLDVGRNGRCGASRAAHVQQVREAVHEWALGTSRLPSAPGARGGDVHVRGGPRPHRVRRGGALRLVPTWPPLEAEDALTPGQKLYESRLVALGVRTKGGWESQGEDGRREWEIAAERLASAPVAVEKKGRET